MWKAPAVRTGTLLIASLSFCQAMMMALSVLYVVDVLHVPAADYGLLLATSALGGIGAGFLVDRAVARFGVAAVLLSATVCCAASYVMLGTTRSVVVAAIAFLLEGVGVAAGSVSCSALRQAATPDALQGRVGSVHMTVVLGVVPLGSFVAGVIASADGVSKTFAFAGALAFICALALAPHVLKYVPKTLEAAAPAGK